MPSVAKIIRIEGSGPNADAGGPYTVVEGGTVTLTAAGSTDPGGRVVHYEWDFNYNGVTFTPDYTTQPRTATFSAAGIGRQATRTVAVRVADNHGMTDLDTATVQITDGFLAGRFGYFGVSGSPTQEGYLSVLPTHTFSLDRGYGWREPSPGSSAGTSASSQAWAKA